MLLMLRTQSYCALAELAEYLSHYPPGTQLVALYAKLKDKTTVANLNDRRIKQIMDDLKGAKSKQTIQISSLPPISETTDNTLIIPSSKWTRS